MPVAGAYGSGNPSLIDRTILNIMTPAGQQQEPKPARGGRRRAPLVWAVVVLVLFAAVTAAVVRSGPVPRTDFLASLETQFQAAPPSEAAHSPHAPWDAAALDAEIQRILSENKGYRIGVALVDNGGGEPTEYGDAAPYAAASTAKIITAAAYYHLVETGEKSLDVPLGSFDAAFQLKAMINTSSDDSWLLLMQDIGYPRLIEYAGSVGLQYDPEQNLVAPGGMALLLRQLATGTLLNPEHTGELLGYMQQTNNERLIPAALDPAITVQHKYGEVEGYVHDASILSSGGRSYSLVIYTWGEDAVESEERLAVIHDLTRTVSGALFGK
jgi:beta-lactamase class A